MLGSMPRSRTVRARVGIVLVAVLAPVLGGCGSASVSSPPSGVDELTIPTPSPDPGDFVAVVDNPWLPLPAGRTWTYDVVDVAGGHRLTITVAPGPDVEGVATTARVSTESGRATTDWFAQDADGNVWWFGREGEWTAGAAGAEAGLAMPADPRVGDGYRLALQEGVVEDVATVTSVRGSATVPAGSYDDLLVTEVTSDLEATGPTVQYWSRGLGLV